MKRFVIFCMLICILTTTFCASMQMSVYADNAIDLTSKSSCLVDFASGQILYEKNST